MTEPDEGDETAEDVILCDAADLISANIRAAYWALNELGVSGERQELLMGGLLSDLVHYKPLAGRYGQGCAREDDFEPIPARQSYKRATLHSSP
jgi:hypothetical protein